MDAVDPVNLPKLPVLLQGVHRCDEGVLPKAVMQQAELKHDCLHDCFAWCLACAPALLPAEVAGSGQLEKTFLNRVCSAPPRGTETWQSQSQLQTCRICPKLSPVIFFCWMKNKQKGGWCLQSRGEVSAWGGEKGSMVWK